MAPSAPGSFAERVARQLGMETTRLAGTGPDGSTTLNDVLRLAGRALPSAARPPAPRSVFPSGEDSRSDVRRLEATCDAKPIHDACNAFGPLVSDAPQARDVVVRLCGAALRGFPELAGVRVRNGETHPRGSIAILVQGSARAVRIPGADEAGIASVRDAVREADTASRAASSPPAEDATDSAAAFVVRLQERAETGSGRSSGESAEPGGATLAFAERSGSMVLELEHDVAREGDAQAFLDRLRTLCLDPRRALL